MLWHGQTRTGISECLYCKQIRYPRVDSERWWVLILPPPFPCSGPIRMLKCYVLRPKFSFGIRRARHYRQRLCSWTGQDTNVYALVLVIIQRQVSESYQGMTSNPRSVAAQEYSKIRYAPFQSTSATYHSNRDGLGSSQRGPQLVMSGCQMTLRR